MKKFNMFGIALILLGIAVGVYAAVALNNGPVLAVGIGILLLGVVVLLMVLSHESSDFTHRHA